MLTELIFGPGHTAMQRIRTDLSAEDLQERWVEAFPPRRGNPHLVAERVEVTGKGKHSERVDLSFRFSEPKTGWVDVACYRRHGGPLLPTIGSVLVALACYSSLHVSQSSAFVIGGIVFAITLWLRYSETRGLLTTLQRCARGAPAA